VLDTPQLDLSAVSHQPPRPWLVMLGAIVDGRDGHNP
jgi:hypothetical protein